MSDQERYSDEEELRRSIRAEIEQRDLERRRSQRKKDARKSASEQAETKRRIYREELNKYYQNRPGYKEVIGEDGETEWIHEEEAKENSELFDQVVEDPIHARRSQKLNLIIYGIVAVLAAIFIVFLLYEGEGTILVSSNVKGASIILDAVPTDKQTDATVVEVSAGEHLITVEKEGYQIVGEAVIEVDLKKGENKLVTFILEPVHEGGEEPTPQDGTETAGGK